MSYRASVLLYPYIQRGTITITTPAVSGTATITAVTPTTAAVRWCGQSGIDSNNRPAEFATVVLTNATTVTATIFGGVSGSVTVSFEVIAWHPSVIKSLQPFSITMTNGGATTGTATVTAVDLTKAALFYGGSAAATSITNSAASYAVQCLVALTATTTVTATRAQASGSGCICTGTVVEFK